MKFIKLKRTFKEGLDNFIRNGWLSFATVSILTISLYIISVTVILGASANIVLKNAQDNINVSVFFNSDVEKDRILEIKDKLTGYQEIKSIDFVSKEQALQRLKKIGENLPAVPKALAILDGNPLLDSLMIKAKEPNQYDAIENALSNSSFKEDINYINYQENKDSIKNLTTIIKLVKQVGLTMGIVFVFIGILITFNAIRLTMYAHKQEFEIMRLVGASNIYIRMPFVFEGIFYGVVSSVTVMLLLFITTKILGPITSGEIKEEIVTFYFSHFFLIFLGLLLSGIVLGTISGVIAIRRYLKV